MENVSIALAGDLMIMNGTGAGPGREIHLQTCGKAMPASSNGIWQGDKPIDYALPLFIIQICIVLLVTRTIAALLKPLRQPRVVAEIIGGVLLGPTALGYVPNFRNTIFPEQSMNILETISDLGLLFFLFLVGLELDLNVLRRTGKQAMVIAAAGICTPFAAGVGLSFYLKQTIEKSVAIAPFVVFMGVAMSITAFPVLARILAERKLLTSDVGQMAMSAAAVNDVVAWILLAIAVSITGSGSGSSPLVALWVLLCGIGLVLFMFLAVKPLVARLSRRIVDSDHVSQLQVCIMFVGVLLSGLATDAIGIHAIFGGFVFGLIIPKDGPLPNILTHKIEDLVSIVMLPLFFVASGLKTNIIGSLNGGRFFYNLLIVVGVACVGKILGTFLAALACKMPPRKALALGILMNTKGLVELIVLNIGKDKKVLNDELFTLLVMMALFTTLITTPLLVLIYKPAAAPRKIATASPPAILYSSTPLQLLKPDDELRIVSCIQAPRNVLPIINLLEATRGLANPPRLRLTVMHLMEITERPSSVMMAAATEAVIGHPQAFGSSATPSDIVLMTFKSYGQLNMVEVKPITIVSRFEDMHEDICNAALERGASIIILPFHRYQREDGTMETVNDAFQIVNKNVLEQAPCSVGILIDRGLLDSFFDVDPVGRCNILVLFIGGADDREALVLGCRMAQHPRIALTVIRLLPNMDVNRPAHGSYAFSVSLEISPRSPFNANDESEVESTQYGDQTEEKRLDEDCLGRVREFNSQIKDPSRAIVYQERRVIDVYAEMSSIARNSTFHLFLVGKGGFRAPSALTLELGKRAVENPELGPIGDVFASTIVQIHHASSVLVVQKRIPQPQTARPMT